MKHCWTTNSSTCSTGYYENCFTERIETNECKTNINRVDIL